MPAKMAAWNCVFGVSCRLDKASATVFSDPTTTDTPLIYGGTVVVMGLNDLRKELFQAPVIGANCEVSPQ